MKYKFIFMCPAKACDIKLSLDNFYYIVSENTDSKNTIFVNVNDIYENLALKVFLGMKHFINNDFDFLCKVDTDTFINFDNLYNYKFDKNLNYGFISSGSNFKIPNTTKSNFVPGEVSFPLGGGYILNKKTVQLLCKDVYIDEIKTQISNNICTFEDVMVGKCIKKEKLPLIDSGYWIDKKNNCYSSCFNSFFHSLNVLKEKTFKSISSLNQKLFI